MIKEYNLPKVAYFSMEYGIDNDMKTYAGGLGILAGDYMKGAYDYNLPMVGIGVKWKQGYCKQKIGEDDKVYDVFHNVSYEDFLEDTGIKVKVKIRNRDVLIKAWRVAKFNTCPLYLLDADLPENQDSWITGQLYGWFSEERIAQEMILGIGGIKVLRKLGFEADVYHFNEGHALFAGFELIKEKVESGLTFKEAVNISKEKIVFTTHTPIIHGNESHTIEALMYMGASNGLSKDQLIQLGGNPFNMTVGALRLSRISNGVAQLHKETSNNMWKHVKNRSEIIGITNAIHLPTWVDEEILTVNENKGDIWAQHMKNKKALIDFVYKRNKVLLDENKLLIGFSRRAAEYKRSNLLFTDESIIEPLLKDRKIQIVFSGKSHPFDDGGKVIVENIVNISRKYPNSVVFLEDYDMNIGKMLTRGADVWLNNPRRPLEASGTSGMKAAMNGVLNLSILDGWWPEACIDKANGWQFGDGKGVDDFETLEELDLHDLRALYKVLIEEVIPTYYENKDRWISMMRESINSTKDQFSIKRMLEDYYRLMYIN